MGSSSNPITTMFRYISMFAFLVAALIIVVIKVILLLELGLGKALLMDGFKHSFYGI